MATSKRNQRNAPRPNPEPFERLIRDDAAPVDAVLDAYGTLLDRFYAAGGHDEVEVVAERPVLDPERTEDTPDALEEPESIDAMLIRRRRRQLLQEREA